MNYSVLMSVYYKENPQYLKQAIDSMLNQTLKPEQFVIVEDGKLNNFLHKMVMLYKEKYSDLFTVIELKVNVGLGMALDIGLQAQPSSGKFWCSMTSAVSQPGTASRSRPVVSYCIPISRSARAVSQSGTVMTADSVTAHKTPSSNAVTMLFAFCFIRIT